MFRCGALTLGPKEAGDLITQHGDWQEPTMINLA